MCPFHRKDSRPIIYSQKIWSSNLRTKRKVIRNKKRSSGSQFKGGTVDSQAIESE